MSDNRNFENDMSNNPENNQENLERKVVHTTMRPDQSQEGEVNQTLPENEVNAEEPPKRKKDSSNLVDLANSVSGTVGSRVTSRASDDIAGVADVDRGLKR
jgi:hypothetical protein